MSGPVDAMFFHTAGAAGGAPTTTATEPVLPDFERPDDTGTKRKLSELQGDNAMVLQLGRGEHCPRERQHH